MSELSIQLRANIKLKKIFYRPFRGFINPFKSTSPKKVIIHCCYHKVGTVWFRRILQHIAAEFGLSFKVGSNYERIHKFESSRDADIFLDYGSHVELDKLLAYRGSHMIRDPRDIVISGYFYHLWTKEIWANLPLVEYGGMSYKEYLNSLDQKEGLLEEIKRLWYWIPHMSNWKYNNPNIFEIKYEDIILNEKMVFKKLFEHYGFKKAAIDCCCKIAEKYSFRNLKKPNKGKSKNSMHMRSGRSGEWKEYFDDEHKKFFKKIYPDALIKLGYEENNNW